MAANIRTEFPRSVREIENTWITLADGTQLAARIWLPEDAEIDPVPGILEYIPYRKNDGTVFRDSIQHPHLARHGYACVRVDMRGCGDSDGILYDEYLQQELDDAVEVIAWLAAQPWCTGAVGMMGKSWGGFNSLQVAALQPPALKAIVTLCSTDDRYATDVHYQGGCILAIDMLPWGTTMLANNARPPDPKSAGDKWREMWFERLEKTPPFVETWLSHQHRDEYWQHGSICENYADITCPVYAVTGWADGYLPPVFDMLENLSVPRKGLIGPWAHDYPTMATLGPAIDFLGEMLRWWDHWLKGVDTGIMDEPMVRLWAQESVPPKTAYDYRPGRWIAEPTWPAPKENIQAQIYHLDENDLAKKAEIETTLTFTSRQTYGLDVGTWWSYGPHGDRPPNQQADDGKSLTFTSASLTEAVDLVGFPEVSLSVSVDRPNALLSVRLCDVAPDGSSLLVSRGVLNLTHRDSHEHPTPIEPGQRYDVDIRLAPIAHTLPAGHRWRLAIGTTYWPYVWPSPETVTLTLFAGPNSKLSLPIRPPRAEDEALIPFGSPEHAPYIAHDVIRHAARKRSINQDSITGLATFSDEVDDGHYRLQRDNLEFGGTNANIFTIVEDDPLSAQVRCERTMYVGRDEWQIKIETSTVMSSDAKHFYVISQLDTYEGNTRVFTKNWTKKILRDLV